MGKYGGGIFHPKWNDDIFETAPLSDKGGIMAILFRNLDLVASQKAICE